MRLRKYYDQDDRPQWISCFFCQATKLRIFLTVILMSDLYGVRLDLNGFDDEKCVWSKNTRDQKLSKGPGQPPPEKQLNWVKGIQHS